jgi:hypothetical protein
MSSFHWFERIRKDPHIAHSLRSLNLLYSVKRNRALIAFAMDDRLVMENPLRLRSDSNSQGLVQASAKMNLFTNSQLFVSRPKNYSSFSGAVSTLLEFVLRLCLAGNSQNSFGKVVKLGRHPSSKVALLLLANMGKLAVGNG